VKKVARKQPISQARGVIERAEHMGGSCINTAPFQQDPRESALYFSGLKQRGLYGIDYSLKENLTVHDFMHHEREVVEMERAPHPVKISRFTRSTRAWAGRFSDPHTLAVSHYQAHVS